ncbi:MAG: UDPGP type 1 family protein [Nitrospiraceae bacterium]|nr:UDPGP type 1 family protein [Nitrospiraceae bacterium]
MTPFLTGIRRKLSDHGQEHLLRFWGDLDDAQRSALRADIARIDFPLMDRLIEKWIRDEPAEEAFGSIQPVPLIPKVGAGTADSREALIAGEEALRAGRVGLFLVAGGQGTRLGFPGPKGSYPIGPVSKRSLFAFHAEKIRNLQARYGCTLPWYIMVSDTNEQATRAFFADNGFFGLSEADIVFLQQRMVPCVATDGRFMLAEPGRLAMNPNGHGGCIPAMVESGVIDDARKRGVDTLCYFQVDNWAVKVADPYFIGHHVMRNAEMSSKNHRKSEPREAVGVHCLCDGEYRVVEYTELDLYPQLLETDEDGCLRHAAGNPAIHILSTDFVERVFNSFDQFPWHRAFKKIPYIDETGRAVKPEEPNGYKFETFIFDALRFIKHDPVAFEIGRRGEYTPIKQFEGANSVVAAWDSMNAYWAEWLEAAGVRVERDAEGKVAVPIEISPAFALTKEEFIEKVRGREWPQNGPIAIGPDGGWIVPAAR